MTLPIACARCVGCTCHGVHSLRGILSPFLLQVPAQKTKEQKNFMSTVEIEEKKFNIAQEQKRKAIEDNQYIKEAEKIFNTKIDKIVFAYS